MKKKLLAVVLSVVMLASLLVPMFAISADGAPTATISLGTPTFSERDFDLDGTPEVNVVGVPVLISGNDSALFTARYQILSNNGLVPHYRVFEEGTDYEYTDEGVDSGDFQQPAGREPIVLNNTVGRDPENTDKTGFQIVQDSSRGNAGISTESGTLITVFFVAPTAPGNYTFELVWMDGCDVSTVGSDKVTTPYDMTVGTSTVTYTIECPGHTGGTATCKDKAVCSVCNVAYGEIDAENHAGGTEVRGYDAPSCNEAGYTGDTYCLGCNEKLEDGEPINPTGEHVDADNDFETNDTQHFHTCSCGTEFDKEDHKGGTATCKDKAVCSVCGVEYGEKNPANHAGGTEVRDYDAPSCNEAGYTGDTYCLGCNEKIEDGEPINPTGEHVDADNAFETNGTQHFHTCSCGTEFDKEDHKGGMATCKDKAVCSVCAVAYGEKDATNHVGGTEIRDAAEAECNTPGYTGDTYCLGCNEKLEDGETINPTGAHVDADGEWEHNGTQHFHTCTCGTEFDKENHFGGVATCKDKAVCSVCNVAYGEIDADNHDFSGKVDIKEEPTADKGGKYTVECANGCGESDERDSKKLATSIEIEDSGVSIKSDEAILPEDITLTVDEESIKEENGKYSANFKFTSQVVKTLAGKAEFAMSLEGTEDIDNIQISLLNADGSTTVVSQIKDGKLVFSADLEGTYMISFTEKVEDEKEDEKAPETPKTNDAMNVVLAAVVALVAALGLVVVSKKRMAL